MPYGSATYSKKTSKPIKKKAVARKKPAKKKK
jgi:hypothetical protein